MDILVLPTSIDFYACDEGTCDFCTLCTVLGAIY